MRQQGSHLTPKKSTQKKESPAWHSAATDPEERKGLRPDERDHVASSVPVRERTDRVVKDSADASRGPGGFARFLVVIVILAAFGVVGAFGVVHLIAYGPSEQAGKIFVRTFDDTATLDFVPHIFMSDEAVRDALDAGKDAVSAAVSLQYPLESSSSETGAGKQDKPAYEQMIELKPISGTNWKGQMLLVHDPSLVILGTPNDSAENGYGEFLQVEEYADKYGAIAGITAAGFRMQGNTPYGFVINHGELLYSESDSRYGMVAFSKDHVMTVGSMSSQEAMDAGYDFAVCWRPVLIKDGVKQTGLGGGFNPRAAIGQTADGTVILVVIEGRMISSLGATYDELADFLLEQGAVNAINLDSGKSSIMVYNGEQITKVALGSGIQDEYRALPNAFLVLPEDK